MSDHESAAATPATKVRAPRLPDGDYKGWVIRSEIAANDKYDASKPNDRGTLRGENYLVLTLGFYGHEGVTYPARLYFMDINPGWGEDKYGYEEAYRALEALGLAREYILHHATLDGKALCNINLYTKPPKNPDDRPYQNLKITRYTAPVNTTSLAAKLAAMGIKVAPPPAQQEAAPATDESIL